MDLNQESGQGQRRGGKRCKGQRGGKNASRRISGGSGTTATQDMCVCPQCGYQEPHQRGFPCFKTSCAKCGAAMTRQ